MGKKLSFFTFEIFEQKLLKHLNLFKVIERMYIFSNIALEIGSIIIGYGYLEFRG